MVRFGQALPDLRNQVTRRLRQDGLSRERVLAAAIGLLDRGLFRAGGEQYVEENGSHGLATLERRHVTLARPAAIRFDFHAKTEKRQSLRVIDPALFEVAAELKKVRRRSARFLAFRTGSHWSDVHSDDVNDFLKELSEPEFSAKDFRTWHATGLAAFWLAQTGEHTTQGERRRAEKEAVEHVAKLLGNTPAVARSSYIDPRVFDRCCTRDRTLESRVDAHTATSAENRGRCPRAPPR